MSHNPLASDQEPSDVELHMITRELIEEARAKALVANENLQATLSQQVAEVRQRFGLIRQPNGTIGLRP